MQVLARVVLSIALISLSACTQRIHSIGYKNPDYAPAAERGATVFVTKSPGVAPSELDPSLQEKMEKLLQRKGYEVGARDDAEFFLLYDYRVRGLMARMSLELVQGATHGMETVKRGGPYVHSLSLRLIQAAAYREDSSSEHVVWSGGAVMNDVPTESRMFADMLLVAAFEQFGTTTSDTVTTRMGLNDPRARQLRK